MQEARQKLKLLKNAQLRQLTQLELQLETTPRDSRFSNALLDLMRKEESLTLDSSGASAVIQKVDELLRQETQTFFSKVASQNIRKLQTLRQRLSEERRSLRSAVGSAGAEHAESGSRGCVTIGDIEREAERLELDYYKNWQQIEVLHLQEAFKAQSSKIDHEWGAHEAGLRAEHAEKKEKATGQRGGASADSSAIQTTTAHNASRWHHPEKQATLIHTAPVLRPQSRRSAPPVSAHAAGELLKMEKEFDDALSAMQKQKTDAKRWLLRQQIRFMAQCEEVKKEKAVVAQLVEEILSDCNK